MDESICSVQMEKNQHKVTTYYNQQSLLSWGVIAYLDISQTEYNLPSLVEYSD